MAPIPDLYLRIFTFLTLCIGARVLLAFVPLFIKSYSIAPLYHIRVLSIILLAISIGFFTIFFGGLRKTGVETLGKPIWWNALRPVHGTLYLISALLSWNARYTYTSIVLGIDVFIGLVSFMTHHLYAGDE